MDKKVLFNDALASIVEFAAANANTITMDDVKLYFGNIIEDESQYDFILEYLNANKINVEGYTPAVNEQVKVETTSSLESEEELTFVEMYMSELEAIPPATDEELKSLLEKHVSGDSSADDRIIECHLKLVAKLAQNFTGKGVTIGDLIQEGNIGLIVALSHYNDLSVDFREYITSSINTFLEVTVNDQVSSDRIGDRLAKKLNQLDDVTKDLSEKLGRVPDVDELAEAMSITREEVEMLLKTSLDTLSVNEDTQITDEDSEDDPSTDDLFVPKDDPLDWRVNKK